MPTIELIAHNEFLLKELETVKSKLQMAEQKLFLSQHIIAIAKYIVNNKLHDSEAITRLTIAIDEYDEGGSELQMFKCNTQDLTWDSITTDDIQDNPEVLAWVNDIKLKEV